MGRNHSSNIRWNLYVAEAPAKSHYLDSDQRRIIAGLDTKFTHHFLYRKRNSYFTCVMKYNDIIHKYQMIVVLYGFHLKKKCNFEKSF